MVTFKSGRRELILFYQFDQGGRQELINSWFRFFFVFVFTNTKKIYEYYYKFKGGRRKLINSWFCFFFAPPSPIIRLWWWSLWWSDRRCRWWRSCLYICLWNRSLSGDFMNEIFQISLHCLPSAPQHRPLVRYCFLFILCQKWAFRRNCTQLEKFLVWFCNDLFVHFTFLLFIFVLVLYCFTAPGRKLLYLRCSLYQPEERYPPPGQLMLCFHYQSLMNKKTKYKHSSSRNWVLTFSNNSVPSIKNWPL